MLLTPVQILKLRLMTEGITVTDKAEVQLSEQGTRPLTLADYATTSGISLRLAEDTWVNAPLRQHNPNFVNTETPHVLDASDGRFVLRSGGNEVPVWPLPVPDYHDRLNGSEERFTSYAITHADRVRISPIEGCGTVCKFCDLPYEYRYRRKRLDGLVESIHEALTDKSLPARHVLISGGTPKAEDFEYLQAVYRAVPTAFPQCAVDVMMVPLPGLLDPRKLHDWGINGLSINVEIYNREVAFRVMREKHRIGLDHYLDFIEEAVGVFGQGKVRSLLIVGLEPHEDTLRAVEELAQRGCDPVLSPFRPDPNTPMRAIPVPGVDLLQRVYLESREIVRRHQVQLGPRCIPCQHNTLTFPDGSGDYFYS